MDTVPLSNEELFEDRLEDGFPNVSNLMISDDFFEQSDCANDASVNQLDDNDEDSDWEMSVDDERGMYYNFGCYYDNDNEEDEEDDVDYGVYTDSESDNDATSDIDEQVDFFLDMNRVRPRLARSG